MTTSRAALSAFVVLTASTFLFGCGAITDKATETAIEQAVEGDGDVDIEQDGDGFSIKTDEGSMAVDDAGNMVIESEDGTVNIESGQELPEDFPDVPLPDGLKIDGAARMADDQGEGTLVHTLSGTVEDDAQSVFKSMVADLESAGYESMFNNEATADGEFSGSAMFSKGETFQIFVNVFDDDGGALVQLSISDAAAN